jgi:hypothetical protein
MSPARVVTVRGSGAAPVSGPPQLGQRSAPGGGPRAYASLW